MPSNKDALEEMKVFLESVPPNVSVRIPGLAKECVGGEFGATRYWEIVDSSSPSRLDLHCNVDDGARRFSASESNSLDRGYRFLEYVCRDCGEYSKTYALLTKLDYTGGDGIPEIMKLGEFPPFSAPISARIQTLLDKDDLELYQKGSRSEAQGLGIGAATYFRRIVESCWKLLVTKLRDAAKKLGYDDLTAFDDALKEIRFSAAVDKLKDAIPDKLLILNGDNPLTVLYSPLSTQLHELTDEECLQQAADIRTVLTALLENIADVLKDQEALKRAANRLNQIKRSK